MSKPNMLTEQVLKNIRLILEKVESSQYDDDTLDDLLQLTTPYIRDLTIDQYGSQEKIEEKQIMTYLFRGWLITNLLDGHRDQVE